MEKIKTIKNVSKTKSSFFDMIKLTSISQDSLSKKERIQRNKIENEKGEITADIIKDH